MCNTNCKKISTSSAISNKVQEQIPTKRAKEGNGLRTGIRPEPHEYGRNILPSRNSHLYQFTWYRCESNASDASDHHFEWCRCEMAKFICAKQLPQHSNCLSVRVLTSFKLDSLSRALRRCCPLKTNTNAKRTSRPGADCDRCQECEVDRWINGYRLHKNTFPDPESNAFLTVFNW